MNEWKSCRLTFSCIIFIEILGVGNNLQIFRKSSCIENFSNTYLVFIWKVQFAEKMQCLWSQRDKTYAFTFKCTECKEVYLIWFFQESLSHNQDNHSLNCVVSLWSQSCLNDFITHGFIKPSLTTMKNNAIGPLKGL